MAGMAEFFSDPQHAWIAAAAVVACIPTFAAIIGIIFIVHDRRARVRATRIEAAVTSVYGFQARIAGQLTRIETESKQRDDALGKRILVLEELRPATANGGRS